MLKQCKSLNSNADPFCIIGVFFDLCLMSHSCLKWCQLFLKHENKGTNSFLVENSTIYCEESHCFVTVLFEFVPVVV